jgi:excinuclease ABC subunit C
MAWPEKVKKRLQELPDRPGVYVMRDRNGRIIYVGKAASLRNRVRHYFQVATRRSADPKLRSLIHSIADFEFLVLRSEADAILTEGRMIKEYRPRYNAHFKDDKRFLMLKVRWRDPFPRFEVCRIRKQDGATYFGPFANSWATRATLEFVEKRFGIRQCTPLVPGPEDYRHCHNDIIRQCAAPCVAKVTPEAYRARVEEACAFLRGERTDVLRDLAEDMEAAAKALDFEKAAALRDLLRMIRHVVKERAKGTKDLDLQREDAAAGVLELQKALGLAKAPSVIECFDISNISGTHAVAGMVCAVGGIPQRQRYRHFRIKTVQGSDDPASMAEVIRRRYTRELAEGNPLPDLVLVDGGVTQLKAARAELARLGCADLPSAGLAKRFEELYVSDRLSDAPIRLPADAAALRVVQRLRDEAHRFALTHHRLLRGQRIRESLLDDVPGIGGKRKQILLSHFGSVQRLRHAREQDIAAVKGIGPVMAAAIRRALDAPGQATRAGARSPTAPAG